MSSLLQFSGNIEKKGVGLEFYQVIPNPKYPEDTYMGIESEMVPCHICGKSHPRIHIAFRKPIGMLGCWVLFCYNGAKHAPDLSHPISIFKIPKGSKPLDDLKNSECWHRA